MILKKLKINNIIMENKVKNFDEFVNERKQKIKEITKEEYMKVFKKPKKEILDGIAYKIHSHTIKDDKYDLTNAWFESRIGPFEVKGMK